MTNLDLITPGNILWEEFMVPLEVSQNQMARDLDITVGRINDIIHGRRSITADTALRLSKYFGTSAEFWLNLQDDFDLRKIRQTVWPTIEPRIRAYSPQSLKKRGQRGLRSLATASNEIAEVLPPLKSSRAILPRELRRSRVKSKKANSINGSSGLKRAAAKPRKTTRAKIS